MNMVVETAVTSELVRDPAKGGDLFGSPRDLLRNRFVYATLSSRARGLSIGVNLNPDQRCNFDCAYCEVDRRIAPADQTLDLDILADELKAMLAAVNSGQLFQRSTVNSECGHLPLRTLSRIMQTVRSQTGLKVEIF